MGASGKANQVLKTLMDVLTGGAKWGCGKGAFSFRLVPFCTNQVRRLIIFF